MRKGSFGLHCRGRFSELVAGSVLIGHPGDVWMASTLGGNPISTAAAGAALSVLRRPGTYGRLHALGHRFREQLRTVLRDRQVVAQGVVSVLRAP